MSNPGDWNGKLTVPKPFNLRTSAPQPKPNNKPATVTNRQNPAVFTFPPIHEIRISINLLG